MAIELCDMDLYDFFIANAPFTLDQVKAIFGQMSSSLIYLHDIKGINHRDIKFDNFLVKKEGDIVMIKLCDFGFAKGICDVMYTQAGDKYWCAPSILTNNSYSDKSDIYSLGLCLYYLLTGTNPFASGDKRPDMTFINSSGVNLRENKEYVPFIKLVEKMTAASENQRLSWAEFRTHEVMKEILG